MLASLKMIPLLSAIITAQMATATTKLVVGIKAPDHPTPTLPAQRPGPGHGWKYYVNKLWLKNPNLKEFSEICENLPTLHVGLVHTVRFQSGAESFYCQITLALTHSAERPPGTPGLKSILDNLENHLEGKAQTVWWTEHGHTIVEVRMVESKH